MTDVMLLCSYSDIRGTGTAFTTPGKRIENFPNGSLPAICPAPPQYTFTDHYGNPLPDNVIVWQHVVMDNLKNETE